MVPKWNESDFAMSALKDLGLLDPTDRVRKPDLVERIIPVLTANHNVAERSEAEVMAKGFMKTQAPVIFLGLSPKYWTPSEEGGSEEEFEGMDALADLLWTETSTSGSVQQALTGRFVMCGHRGRRNVTNPDGSMSPAVVQVRFVTENAAVANVYYTTPVTGSFVRKAESVTKQLDMLLDRMPENAHDVAALLSPAVQEAVNRLSQITERAGLRLGMSSDGKLAITAGDSKKAS